MSSVSPPCEYHLNIPYPELGCVIMASGLSQRFGSNKLLYPIHGKPMIDYIFSSTDLSFLNRVVVTRHPEIEEICCLNSIPVILHDLPYRNQTVSLGLNYLLAKNPDLVGCMFVSSDQPFLTGETFQELALAFSLDGKHILRPSFKDTPGNPILFPSEYYKELLALPEKKGGSFIASKHPDKVQFLPVKDKKELLDIDTLSDLKYIDF